MSIYVEDIYTESFWVNRKKAIVSEFKETIESLLERDYNNSLYELSQLMLYMLILTYMGLNKLEVKIDLTLPNWLPWEEDYLRLEVWNQLLSLSGITSLDKEWFNQGNNWRKPSKVQYVLNQSGVCLSLEECQALIDLVSKCH